MPLTSNVNHAIQLGLFQETNRTIILVDDDNGGRCAYGNFVANYDNVPAQFDHVFDTVFKILENTPAAKIHTVGTLPTLKGIDRWKVVILRRKNGKVSAYDGSKSTPGDFLGVGD